MSRVWGHRSLALLAIGGLCVGGGIAYAATLAFTSGGLSASAVPTSIPKFSPTLTSTALSASSVTAGSAVTATSSISGGTAQTTGPFSDLTWAAYVWNGSSCASTASATVTRAASSGLAGQSYTSPPLTLPAAGSYKVAASYPGDARNQGTTQACAAAPTLTVTPSGLSISSLVIANGPSSTAGRLDEGDTITVTFSAPVLPSSLCSAFSDAGGAQTIGGGGSTNDALTVQVADGGAGHDTVTVTSSSGGCSTPRFGTLLLGSGSWVSSTLTYNGNGNNATTASLNADGTVLTLKVGRGTATNAVADAQATYTPHAGVRDRATQQVPVVGTKSAPASF